MERSNTIGTRIERLRRDKGLTQAELAREMGVKRETIVQWESNTRDLKTVATVKLADFFNTTCDYLLRGIEAKYVDASKLTGLSGDALHRLTARKQLEDDPLYFELLNAIVADTWLERFIDGLSWALSQVALDTVYQTETQAEIDPYHVLNEAPEHYRNRAIEREVWSLLHQISDMLSTIISDFLCEFEASVKRKSLQNSRNEMEVAEKVIKVYSERLSTLKKVGETLKSDIEAMGGDTNA